MPGILDYMAGEHRKCDEHFAAAEMCVSKSDWQEANASFTRFVNSLERHFRMEEQVLFRHLEGAMGTEGGPLPVMKMEHQQMRELVDTLTGKMKAQDRDGYLGASETLLVLMQQHNMKEEQILYPMAERMLSSGQDKIIKEMEGV